MKKLVTICAVAILVLAISGVANATINVDIYGSPAPNAYAGASSFNAWWSNACYAIHNGLTTYGIGNAQYAQISSTGGQSDDRPGYEAVVSGFDSWHGVAGGTGEWGTRMHFIYNIKATAAESLSLASISGLDILEDGWGDEDFSCFGGAASFDSSTTFVAAKRIGFAVDGTIVTTGTVEAWDAAHIGNEIMNIIGTFGMAYAAYFPATYYGGTTAQEELDLTIADIDANLQNWTGTITYGNTAVDTTVTFVPEPATIVILSLGGLLLRRKK